MHIFKCKIAKLNPPCMGKNAENEVFAQQKLQNSMPERLADRENE